MTSIAFIGSPSARFRPRRDHANSASAAGGRAIARQLWSRGSWPLLVGVLAGYNSCVWSMAYRWLAEPAGWTQVAALFAATFLIGVVVLAVFGAGKTQHDRHVSAHE